MIQGNSMLADGFVIDIGGAKYRLRGFNVYESWDASINRNVYLISLNIGNDDYMKYVAGLLAGASNATLSYELLHNVYYQIIDVGSAFLPAFGPQAVNIQD